MQLALKQTSRVAATELRPWKRVLPGSDRAFVSSGLQTTHNLLLETTSCCRPSGSRATYRVSSEWWRQYPRVSPHVAALFTALPDMAPLRPTYEEQAYGRSVRTTRTCNSCDCTQSTLPCCALLCAPMFNSWHETLRNMPRGFGPVATPGTTVREIAALVRVLARRWEARRSGPKRSFRVERRKRRFCATSITSLTSGINPQEGIDAKR
jgi:hypothetical protein